MDGAFENFREVLKFIKGSKKLVKADLESLFEKLVSIFNNFQVSGKKITSASKFIDFFVHDILDYTLLNRNGNFTQDNSVFDVREAVK